MVGKPVRQRCSLALIVAAAMAPAVLWALPIDQIPNPRRTQGNWVSDVANILQPETEQRLNTLISQLQAANGSEIAVVTIPDSAPLTSPKELATQLFHSWGIGQKGRDNGLLFLISLGDRRVEIETGYGLEAVLPDAKVGRIIKEQIAPAFKAGNYDAGSLAGTEAIVQSLQGKDIGLSPDSQHRQLIEAWLVFIVLGGSPIILIATWLSNRFVKSSSNLATSLQGLTGLVLVRGLGQSIKLFPRQSSRAKAWHLSFETAGAMRCAVCGGTLEPVDDDAVERILKPSEKAAVGLGSLQVRGWRCGSCAPETMHLRGYESTSKRFARCPNCQELTVTREDPYVIPNTSFLGPDWQITNSRCVNCDYTNQTKEPARSLIGSDDNSSDSGGFSLSSGTDFSGGSSGGGGAGGDW